MTPLDKFGIFGTSSLSIPDMDNCSHSLVILSRFSLFFFDLCMDIIINPQVFRCILFLGLHIWVLIASTKMYELSFI